MDDPITFNQWYREKDLSYLVHEKQRGTDILIRGDIHSLHELITQLDNIYFSNDSRRFLDDRIVENFRTLKKTLISGVSQGDVIFFKDDRVRHVFRMDVYTVVDGTPYQGSKDHLEILLNEQYGGAYPADSVSSPRANLIRNVKDALTAMNPSDRQISHSLTNMPVTH